MEECLLEPKSLGSYGVGVCTEYVPMQLLFSTSWLLRFTGFSRSSLPCAVACQILRACDVHGSGQNLQSLCLHCISLLSEACVILDRVLCIGSLGLHL